LTKNHKFISPSPYNPSFPASGQTGLAEILLDRHLHSLTFTMHNMQNRINKLKQRAMKTIALYRVIQWRVLPVMILLIAACLLPGLSYGQFGQEWPVSFDGAPALKPAQLEISLFGAGSYHSSINGGGTVGYIPGARVGIGIIKNLDVKLAYGRGFYKFTHDKLQDSKVNNLCLAPKYSLLNGHLAIQVPFTVMFANWESYDGENKTETLYLLTPRLIGTIRVKNLVEFNLAPFFNAFFPGHDIDPLYFVGGNLGVAVSTNLDRWSIRPEGFVTYYIPKSGATNYKSYYYGWGLAFTYNIDL
jgi:hypothetical protein